MAGSNRTKAAIKELKKTSPKAKEGGRYAPGRVFQARRRHELDDDVPKIQSAEGGYNDAGMRGKTQQAAENTADEMAYHLQVAENVNEPMYEDESQDRGWDLENTRRAEWAGDEVEAHVKSMGVKKKKGKR